jgi:hypothetical protein
VLKESALGSAISNAEIALKLKEVDAPLFHAVKLVEKDSIEVKTHPAEARAAEAFIKENLVSDPFNGDTEAAIADAKKLAEAELVQDELTAAKAEQDATFAPREWIVTHLRHTYETTAKTPEGAVNNIRFKLYGTRPMRTLAPFHAEPKRVVGRGNIPISRAAERLAKLAAFGRQ